MVINLERPFKLIHNPWTQELVRAGVEVGALKEEIQQLKTNLDTLSESGQLTKTNHNRFIIKSFQCKLEMLENETRILHMAKQTIE